MRPFPRVARLPRPGRVRYGLTPAFLGSDLVRWYDPFASDNCTDTAGTLAVAAAGNSVAFRRDLSRNQKHLTQGTAANQPTWQAGPTVSFDGTNDNLVTGGGVTFALTGAFTAYMTGVRSAAGVHWIAFGHSVTGGSLHIQSDNNVYCINDTPTLVSAAYTGNNGTLILARWRRKADNTVLFAATGMAEASLGTLSGTITINAQGGRTASQFTTGSHRTAIVAGADLVTDGRDKAIRSYIQAADGVGL